MDLFLALIFSALLWVLCVFLGKALSSTFRPTILHHLVCLVVALISCICFVVIFKMNKANRAVENVQLTVNEIVAGSADIAKAAQKTQNLDQANELTAKTVKSQLKKQMPFLSRFISTDSIEDMLESSEQKTNGGQTVVSAGEYLGLLTSAVDSVGGKIRKKIKSYRNGAIFIIIFFQAIAFIAMGYSASKSGKSFGGVYYDSDGSGDYDCNY